MSDNYEQPVEPMSRVEDILRGDATVRPMSRVEELLKELIEAGGGGGGSTVVVTPIQQSGTKIANITVNGTGYDIFAPEGSSGSVVTIDPEYQSGTLLATLTIDSTDYYIYAPSGGGTTVVANPEGEATDTLEKIQIGNDIYSIEGGGSTTPFTEEDLWINSNGSGIGTYTLAHSIDDYDFLAIYYGLYDEYTSGILISDYRLVSVDDLNRLHTDGKKQLITGWQNRTIYIDFNQATMVISTTENGNVVLKVRGIKLPKGEGTNGGSTETTLYSQTPGAWPSTLTLSDSYKNYDRLQFYVYKYDAGNYYDHLAIQEISTDQLDMIQNSYISGRTNVLQISGWHRSDQYIRYSITNNTTFTKVQSGGDWGLIKVVGVKFGGSSGSESSGPNSEIIPLGPGDGTTTRTFNLQRTPKKVSIYWYEDWTGEYNQNWSSYYSFIWGQERAYGLGGGTDVEARNQIAKVASIAYGQDGKSFSLTGGDVGSSCNTDNAKHYGYLYLEYGSGSGSENIEDMTWTLLTSTTGIGTPIAIPSRIKRLVVLVKCDGKVQIVGNESLAAINKVLDITGESDYILGGYWTDQSNSNHGDNTCIISNGLVTAYSSYNTITTYVYALS